MRKPKSAKYDIYTHTHTHILVAQYYFAYNFWKFFFFLKNSYTAFISCSIFDLPIKLLHTFVFCRSHVFRSDFSRPLARATLLLASLSSFYKIHISIWSALFFLSLVITQNTRGVLRRFFFSVFFVCLPRGTTPLFCIAKVLGESVDHTNVIIKVVKRADRIAWHVYMKRSLVCGLILIYNEWKTVRETFVSHNRVFA